MKAYQNYNMNLFSIFLMTALGVHYSSEASFFKESSEIFFTLTPALLVVLTHCGIVKLANTDPNRQETVKLVAAISGGLLAGMLFTGQSEGLIEFQSLSGGILTEMLFKWQADGSTALPAIMMQGALNLVMTAVVVSLCSRYIDSLNEQQFTSLFIVSFMIQMLLAVHYNDFQTMIVLIASSFVAAAFFAETAYTIKLWILNKTS